MSSRLQEARERLMRMIGTTPQWELLDSYLVEYLARAGVSRDGTRERVLGEP